MHKVLAFLVLAPILLWYTLCASAAENQADDRLSRGMEAMKKGYYREALSLFESSEEWYTGQNNPSGIALSMLWKARVLATTGDGRKARACFDKVVAMTEKGSTPPSGDSYFYRGAQAFQEKNYRQAQDDFKMALSRPPGTIHRSLILLFHAQSCQAGGDYNRAYHFIELALKEKGVPPFLATMLQCTRACIYADLKQPQKALQTFQQALKMAEENPGRDPYLRSYVCYYMGRFYRDQGIHDDAARYFKQAAAALQQPDSLVLPEEASYYPDMEKPLYESLLGLLTGQGREKEALYYCLQAREREIKKKFVFSQGFYQDMLPLLRAERHAMTAADMAGPAAKLAELKKDSSATRLSSLTAPDERVLLHEGIDDWYQSILYSLDDRDLRLDFYVGGDATFLWVLDGASLVTFVIPEGEQKLSSRLGEIHRATADRQKKLTGLATVLHIPEQLAGKEKILLGLHGVLYSVPFAALPDRAGTPLLQKVEIRGIPPSPQKVESTGKKRLLVLCGQDTSGAAETRALAPSYSPRIIIEEQQVTPDRLKTAFDDCTLGHLALPWRLDLACADLSGILTPRGFYSLFDFASSPAPMECAVVSRYEEIGENGSPGLPLLCHAFMTAGTGTVAVTTWTVPGDERVYLFGMFYKHIKNGFTPVSAFRNAQLAAKQQFPESMAWSYFTIVSGE